MAPGDRVRLKTSGPTMVVSEVSEDGQVTCWYWGVSMSAEPGFQRMIFPKVVLCLADR